MPSGLTSRTVGGGSCAPALHALRPPVVQIAHGHSCRLLCGVGTWKYFPRLGVACCCRLRRRAGRRGEVRQHPSSFRAHLVGVVVPSAPASVPLASPNCCAGWEFSSALVAISAGSGAAENVLTPQFIVSRLAVCSLHTHCPFPTA